MTFNPDLIHFIVTVVLSFLVGLEVKAYRLQFHKDDPKNFIGSSRTFAFVGMLGFIFYKIDMSHLAVYIAGMLGITLLYALFYHRKLSNEQQSILLYLTMLIVYTLGPLSLLYPIWMSALIFVLIVFILNAKKSILRFTMAIDTYEFETLGKMVLLSAVILPLLPNQNVIPYLPLSPFKIWLAVVVISAISYGGYLVQKYLLPSKGLFLTGLIGGTYSSTATTVVLARKAKDTGNNPVITAAIIAATSMMYFRLIVVAMVFNMEIATALALPFLLLAFAGLLLALIYLKQGDESSVKVDFVDKNPLELGTAFLFAALFVAMMLLTDFVMHHYGNSGLKLLSFSVGFTDIDPFVLSLLTGKYSAESAQLVSAIMIATGSNNILKSVYSLWFGGVKGGLHAAVWIAILGIVTMGLGFWVYF